VVLDKGKLSVKISDQQLARLVQADVMVHDSSAKITTRSDGQKTLTGGIKVYNPGTPEHLEAMMKSVSQLGYYAEKSQP